MTASSCSSKRQRKQDLCGHGEVFVCSSPEKGKTFGARGTSLTRPVLAGGFLSFCGDGGSETEFHYITQVSLEFAVVLLPRPAQCWLYKSVSPCQV